MQEAIANGPTDIRKVLISTFGDKAEVAGTFMVKDVPIGNYLVKLVYPGKTLLKTGM
jgi:hypothetical protein